MRNAKKFAFAALAGAGFTVGFGASAAKATFTFTLSAPTISGLDDIYLVKALNVAGTGTANTGTKLLSVNATVVSQGVQGTAPGALVINLTDLDGDGVADVNNYGSGLSFGSVTGTFARVGSATTFNNLANTSPAPYTTDPQQTGAQTQNLNPVYTNGTDHTLNTQGFSTGVTDNVTAQNFMNIVVPIGTIFTASGSVAGDMGNSAAFSLTNQVVSTAQSIISLTPGSTAPTTYGSGLGNLVVKSTGVSGSYVPATATVANLATGFFNVSGFSPTTDSEVYALKLNLNGGTDAGVVNDINAVGGSTGVTASLISGVYTKLFPGYDILLTSTAATNAANTTGTSEFAFDFTQDTTAGDTGVTVAAIAAVPEPATAAGVVLGAAGLLLGRRKNRIAAV